jgi:ribosome-associated protein
LDASAERSQFQNRADALARLRSLVAAARIVPKPRRPTQPGRAAKQRRLDAKQRRGALKRDRGGGDSD